MAGEARNSKTLEIKCPPDRQAKEPSLNLEMAFQVKCFSQSRWLVSDPSPTWLLQALDLAMGAFTCRLGLGRFLSGFSPQLLTLESQDRMCLPKALLSTWKSSFYLKCFYGLPWFLSPGFYWPSISHWIKWAISWGYFGFSKIIL